MLNRAKVASQALSRSDSDPQTSTAEGAEYVALETTLRSSELGRRFLADYARQHPTPEVKLLLEALARLETASVDSERQYRTHGLVSELVAMSETISAMRREIGTLCLSGIPNSDPMTAPCAFEQILDASAQATSDVLEALEEIQTVSSALREKGIASDYCDRLDESAVEIYTACARREMAGQQTADAFNLLRDMERRIDALIEDWSDHETQNLLDAAKALDLSEAFEAAPAPARVIPVEIEPARDEPSQVLPDRTPEQAGEKAQEAMPTTRRTNRLVPEDVLPVPANDTAPADAPAPAEPPAMPGPHFEGQRAFERPEPLTLEALVAAQRAALFG